MSADMDAGSGLGDERDAGGRADDGRADDAIEGAVDGALDGALDGAVDASGDGADGQGDRVGDAQDVEELVAAYLASLAHEAERLEWSARQELLDDVRSHIDVALAESENPDRAELTRILSALGDPREIVDAASADSPTAFGAGVPTSTLPPVPPMPLDPGAPYPLGGREVAAILLLLIGAFVVGIGWLVGLWLLWTSPRWSNRDKLIGTFVLPGGLAPLALIAGTASGSTACTTTGDGPPACVHHGVVLSAWPAALVATLLIAVPLATSFYLWRRARTVRPMVPANGRGMAAISVGVAVVFGVMVAGCGAFLLAGATSTTHSVTTVPEVSQEAPVASPLP